ncbi:hypothetical protein ACJVDH_16180 [Pedobacter sp. AW1-32]|uniref:hypothetical protein n=1 Tax=Pedobacter sp. AW1-32 TaxID=3383026 RepID=UPI003FEE4157
MEAYKFKTKVSENGTIVVPEGFDVKNKEVEVIIKEVEVIILDNPIKIPAIEKMTGKEFVKKYAGMFNDSEADQAKWEYLKEKHNL